ncbi:MAG: hypothetical protein JO166_01815 [Deltaproteobacteria bacterium]|nr:hypothetical protein [Deltaproteobacteria bacterium]
MFIRKNLLTGSLLGVATLGLALSVPAISFAKTQPRPHKAQEPTLVTSCQTISQPGSYALTAPNPNPGQDYNQNIEATPGGSEDCIVVDAPGVHLTNNLGDNRNDIASIARYPFGGGVGIRFTRRATGSTLDGAELDISGFEIGILVDGAGRRQDWRRPAGLDGHRRLPDHD